MSFFALLSLIFSLPCSALSAAEPDNADFGSSVSALSSTAPFIRAQAAGRLARSGRKDAVPHLVKAISDPSPLVRRQAAAGLGQLRAVEAVPQLGAVLEMDQEVQARQAAALALADISDPRSVPSLLKCLRDGSVQVVFPCVRALGGLRPTEAVAPLKRLLSSTSPDLKSAVITALGHIGSIDAYAVLRSEAGKKRTSAEEAASVEAFGAFPGPDPSNRVKKALTSKDERVKASACLALARRGDVPETAVCAGLLASSDAGVRERAARALGMMGDATALPAIEAALAQEKDAGASQSMRSAAQGLRAKAGMR